MRPLSRFLVLPTALISLGLAPSVSSGQEYFGEDLNTTEDPNTPEDDPVPLAVYPNAEAARASFLAGLSSGVETESFEGLAKNTLPPFDLTFGSDTAALSGEGEVRSVPFSGVYPTDGSNFYFLFLSGSTSDFRIDFSAPQAAFGFLMNDVGDGLGQLTLTFERAGGGTDVVAVPTTPGAGSGSIAFYGRIDPANPFVAVTFSNNSTGDGFGFDELTVASPGQVIDVVDSFFLPSKVAYKPNASDPAKGKLVSAGIFDTGSEAVDLTGAATLDVGAFSVPIPALTPKGAGFLFRDGGVSLSIKPSKKGSSRAKFKLVVVGDLTGAVDPNQPLPVRFSNAALDARGEVALTGGKFKLGRRRGALSAPTLYLAKLKAKVRDGPSDAFTLTAGLATDGQTPASASDVTVGVGEVFVAVVLADQFVRIGDRWIGSDSVGDVVVTLDYLRETATVRVFNGELGSFAEGPVPLSVELSVGSDIRATRVRAVRKGETLRY